MSKKLGFFEDFMLSGVAAGVSKVIITYSMTILENENYSDRQKII